MKRVMMGIIVSTLLTGCMGKKVPDFVAATTNWEAEIIEREQVKRSKLYMREKESTSEVVELAGKIGDMKIEYQDVALTKKVKSHAIEGAIPEHLKVAPIEFETLDEIMPEYNESDYLDHIIPAGMETYQYHPYDYLTSSQRNMLLFGTSTRPTSLRAYKSKSETAKDMVLITVDVWKLNGKAGTRRFTVNKKLKEQIELIFKEIFEHPSRPILDGSISSDGCYNHRGIGGGDRPSNHTHGAAIDLNVDVNPQSYKPRNWNPTGSTEFPSRSFDEVHPVVQIFEAHGWRWGGKYVNVAPDYMHFEFIY